MNTAKNIDPAEIAKFEDIAMRWWDKNGEFKPLHDINPSRLNYIKTHAKGLSGKKILDVGCGGGILAEALSQEGAIVTGIDMGESNLKVAKMHLFESKLDIDYRWITVEELAEQEKGQYDIVTCLEMLEHVPQPDSIIDACASLLKPDGDLFLSTINRQPKAYLFGVVAAEYLLKILPKGTHDYKKFIQPAELNTWLRKISFKIQDLQGMTYNPFSRQCHFNDDIDINYILHAKQQSCL